MTMPKRLMALNPFGGKCLVLMILIFFSFSVVVFACFPRRGNAFRHWVMMMVCSVSIKSMPSSPFFHLTKSYASTWAVRSTVLPEAK